MSTRYSVSLIYWYQSTNTDAARRQAAESAAAAAAERASRTRACGGGGVSRSGGIEVDEELVLRARVLRTGKNKPYAAVFVLLY
jgi:hypothetical protein